MLITPQYGLKNGNVRKKNKKYGKKDYKHLQFG